MSQPRYPENMHAEIVWSNMGQEFVVTVYEGGVEVIGNRGKTLSDVLEDVADDIRERWEL